MATSAAAAEGYDVVIVTGDKDFFQLVRDGIRVFNPRDEGTWYDEAGVKEKFGVAPGPGGRRARAHGRHDRQREGRAGHRRERRARSDRRPTARSTRCSSAPPTCRRRSIARRCSPTRTKRGAAASCCGFTPTCRSSSTSSAFRYRGPSREACYELFSELGFRSLYGVRTHRRHDEQATTGSSTTLPSSRHCSTELGGVNAFGCGRRAAERQSVGRPTDRGRLVRPGERSYVPTRSASWSSATAGTARLRADSSSGPLAPSRCWTIRCRPRRRSADVLAALQAGARGSRRSRRWATTSSSTASCWRGTASPRGSRAGHDARQLPAGCDAVRPPLEATALEHLGYKALTEEDVCGRGAKAVRVADAARPSDAQLRRGTGRPGAAARAIG